jgi:hypothetical protein
MTGETVTMQDLLAYAAGELTGEAAERVAAFVAERPDAARTVELYRVAKQTTADDDTVAAPAETIARAKAIFSPQPATEKPGWLERLDAVIARLVYDSRVQPAAVRYVDSGRRIQMSFETDDADVDLELERHGRADSSAPADRWTLTGQVGADPLPAGVEVALLRADHDEPIATARCDERGMFTLEATSGRYELRIRLGDAVVVLPDIAIE